LTPNILAEKVQTNQSFEMSNLILNQLKIYPPNGSGVMSMENPCSLTLEISIFPNIVDHAGLMLQPLPCLIVSRLPVKLHGLISTSPLKFLSLAQVMTVATVVKLTMLLSGCMTMKLLMRPAQSIVPVDTTTELNAHNNSCVRTVVMMVAAGLKITTRFTKPMSMVQLREKRP
jgi:hypothetical protein